MRLSILAQCNRLTVENQRSDVQGTHRFDQFWYRGADVVEPPTVDAYLVAQLVRLDPRTIHLPLERSGSQLLQSLPYVRCRLRQHGEHRMKQLQ